MRFRGIFLYLLVLLALYGCAETPKVADEASEVINLLDYHERLHTMSSEEQRREYQAAQVAYENRAGDLQRLRLALLLTLPRTSWRDDARALHLLGGLKAAPPGQTSPRRDLALLIQKLVAERQRQIREENRKIEDLQQKIDALRAIDLDIRRNQPHR